MHNSIFYYSQCGQQKDIFETYIFMLVLSTDKNNSFNKRKHLFNKIHLFDKTHLFNTTINVLEYISGYSLKYDILLLYMCNTTYDK